MSVPASTTCRPVLPAAGLPLAVAPAAPEVVVAVVGVAAVPAEGVVVAVAAPPQAAAISAMAPTRTELRMASLPGQSGLLVECLQDLVLRFEDLELVDVYGV